jgi:hypothetical protein
MGVNEENCISWYLSNLMKGEPCCFLLIPCLPFGNTHASCRIGSDTIDFENAPSFIEANFPRPLNQGNHRVYTLYRFLLYNLYLMSMIVHLSIGV